MLQWVSQPKVISLFYCDNVATGRFSHQSHSLHKAEWAPYEPATDLFVSRPGIKTRKFRTPVML